MIDLLATAAVGLAGTTAIASLVAANLTRDLRYKAMQLRAMQADAAELNRLLDRRQDRIESQSIAIGELTKKVAQHEAAESRRNEQREAARMKALAAVQERKRKRLANLAAEKNGVGVSASRKAKQANLSA